MSVDPATGAVALRGIVPNPERQLLPGMFVNVHLTFGTVNRGFLVPQAGLQRDGTGPYVLVVGADDKVVLKRVRVDGQHGQDWIVTDGLTDGDRIIVSGTQNARPGSQVPAVPYQVQGAHRSPRPPRPRRPEAAMPQFFIDRPVFAWVLAILITLGGILALTAPADRRPIRTSRLRRCSVSRPTRAPTRAPSRPPSRRSSSSSSPASITCCTSPPPPASDGSAHITLTFENGTNPDIAAVQTQNRVTLATPRLPAEVNQQGIRIAEGQRRIPRRRRPALEPRRAERRGAQQHRRLAGAGPDPAHPRRGRGECSSVPSTRCASG